MRRSLTCLFAAALVVVSAAAASAQDDDDAVLKPAEPDFTLVALPTALRVPLHKGAFRVSHRFTRPLSEGDFGDLAADLFGMDGGAQIGLEYRFGIVARGQIGFHRTSNRNLELFAQYDLLPAGKPLPFDVSVRAALDNSGNFKGSRSPSVGAIISKIVGDRAALYVEPTWVNNANPLPKQVVDHNDTFMVGIGARVRIRPTVNLVAELTPRSGFTPGLSQGSFAIEKRAGGHLFQLNFSNGIGTTMTQIARGGPAPRDWFVGFNISRKFY